MLALMTYTAILLWRAVQTKRSDYLNFSKLAQYGRVREIFEY